MSDQLRPVRVESSNFTFMGPSPEIADLPCQIDRIGHRVSSVFKLTDVQRARIAAGANIELSIFQIPMPPVALKLNSEGEVWNPGDRRCPGCGAVWSSDRPEVTRCGHCGGTPETVIP